MKPSMHGRNDSIAQQASQRCVGVSCSRTRETPTVLVIRHTHTRTDTHTHRHSHTCTHRHTHTQTHTHTHRQTDRNTHTHAHTQTHTHTHRHTHTQTHTHTHCVSDSTHCESTRPQFGKTLPVSQQNASLKLNTTEEDISASVKNPFHHSAPHLDLAQLHKSCAQLKSRVTERDSCSLFLQ